MNALNINHVLADNIQELEHGVRLSPQGSIDSGTLVCFLDSNGQLHFGFSYKNGSNLLVICWENNARRNKTPPKGAFIIAFDQELTQKKRKGNFTEADFNFQWFNANAQQNVADELRALNNKRDKVKELIERLAGLTVQELDVVNQKIDALRNNWYSNTSFFKVMWVYNIQWTILVLETQNFMNLELKGDYIVPLDKKKSTSNSYWVC